MRGSCLPAIAGSLALTLLLAACSQGNSGDPPNQPAGAPVAGPDSFLLFPNPQVQLDGSFQTNSIAYAQAYYAAIDPANAKDTLAKWKAANGFGSGGSEFGAVFRDTRDLGYGRRMTGRQNADGTIAFFVENYQVNAIADAGYTPLNLDAAVVQDQRWKVFVNAIEYSPGPGGGVSFAKFFNFNATTGAREPTADVDGRGQKALPGVCVSCHGGRGDPLTPPGAGGLPLFPLVPNSASLQRGDVEAKLMPFEVDTLEFSATPGYTRADQEKALEQLNRLVLCTYPLPTGTVQPTGFAEDACNGFPRRVANGNEWQGTAAALIKAAYGGDGMPNKTFTDTFVPPGWAGQTALYRNAVVPACRVCHLVRGTLAQSDIDFDTFLKFQLHADRIKAHVIDRGNMPLAKIVFDAFWGSSKPDMLATFLQGEGFTVRDAAGAVLKPGRPVADPGPKRTITQGATTLSAAGSLFASTYNWSIVSGPGGTVPPAFATLTNPNTARPTFNAAADGRYVLQLVVGNNAGTQSAPEQLLLVVDPLAPVPPIRFSDITGVLRGVGCTGCHTDPNPTPPIVYTDVDRDGVGGPVADATDDLWFYTELRGRINFTDLVASPLLRKPSGNHHSGGSFSGTFDASLDPGQPGRANYDLFLNWILNSAPQQ
jgi:hypothetical protein